MSQEFHEILKDVKGQVTWKVTQRGEDKAIYSQEKPGFFLELSPAICKTSLRDIETLTFSNPSTISNLVTALLEDSNRLFDDGLFRECRKRIVGFENGVFDLQTGKMRDYTTNDFILDPLPHKIPSHIDKDVERWFMDILSDWVSEDVSDWFADVLAYFLFIYPNGENLWMNFFEAGRNGKSSCLKLLEKIVGDDKAIGCDLQHINRFSNATFQGKWLILGRDSSNFVNDGATSFIKNYSGDDKALVERKGGDSYDTYTTGKIIVSTNGLIQSKDRSYGWYRRLLPIPFPNVFPLDPTFEANLFKQIPQIIRILLHRAYLYRHNKIPVSQYLPDPVKKLKEETRYLNDRVIAFWELEFFDKASGMHGVTSKPRIEQFLKVHKRTMSEVYDLFEDWHHKFFGDGQVEPSLKSFGGPYGAFLSHSKEYFSYSRKRDGRYVELHPKVLADFQGKNQGDSITGEQKELL